jgi:hypothetical protein
VEATVLACCARMPSLKCPSGNILSVWNRLWLPGRRFDLEEAADVDE